MLIGKIVQHRVRSRTGKFSRALFGRRVCREISQESKKRTSDIAQWRSAGTQKARPTFPICGVAMIASIVSLAVQNTDAPAQALPGFRVIDFVIDAPLCEELLLFLAIQNDQKEQFTRSHIAYLDSVRELDSSIAKRMEEAGTRELATLLEYLDPLNSSIAIKQAGADKGYSTLAELSELRQDDPQWKRARQLQTAIRAIRTNGLHQSDQMLYDWIDLVVENLNLAPIERDRMVRVVRRDNVFGRNEVRADFTVKFDLVGMIDPAVVCGEAVIVNLSPQAKSLLAQELAEIRDACEMQLDVVAVEILNQRRQEIPSSQSGSFSPATARGRRVLAQWGQAWGRRYDIFEYARISVGECVYRHCGEAAKGDWDDKTLRTLCPEMAAERWPDQMSRWLAEHGPTEAQTAFTADLYKRYVQDRRVALQQAIQAGAAIKRRRFISQPTIPQESDLHLAKQLLRLHRLAKHTIREFASALTPDQKTSLVALFARRDPLMMGPYINEVFVRHMGAMDEYTSTPFD